MTAGEALERVDALLHNAYSQEEKLAWLGQVESRVSALMGKPFSPLGRQSLLLAGEPHSAMYLHWLESRIHYHNGEYDRYNNAASLFNGLFWDFEAQLLRKTAQPKGDPFRF